MAEIFTVSPAFNESDGIAGTSRSLGMEWETSDSGQQITSIRVYIHNNGPFAGTRAQVWASGNPTALFDVEIGAVGVAGTWYTVPEFVTPIPVAANTLHIVNSWIPGTSVGNYNFEDPGGPIVNGSISAHSIYRNGGAFTLAPNEINFPSGLFGADILLEAAGTQANAGSASGGGVANNATVLTSVVATAGLAAGSGTAGDGGGSISVSPTTAGGTGQALSPNMEVEGDVHLYKFGPCVAWTPVWPRGDCASVLLNTDAAAVTGSAVQAASEILYQLTAQRFGTCSVKLRPCRQSCSSTFPWSTWWEYGTYPQPYWWNGTWYNLACGSCPSDSCSCVALEQTVLPGPVLDVTEVKVNGIVLVRDVDYRLDDYRKLVRLGGELWPFCQNMNLADTEVDTWSVTADYGELVPTLGQLAVGELALEIVKYILCEDCALPQGVVDISRQGVSMSMAQISDLFNTGFIQLRMCDLFIKTANPNHMQARSAVYDLDGPQHRAVGTW